MFAYDKRAFSHGCMRVQDPPKYAEVLLSLVRPSDDYTRRPHQEDVRGTQRDRHPLPDLHPGPPDLSDRLRRRRRQAEFRDDVYGRDKALLAILKGDERKVADIPVEHKEDISHRQVLAMPDQPSLFGGSRGLFSGGGSSYSAGGDNFFSRLFGSFASAPPPTPHKPHPASRRSPSGEARVPRRSDNCRSTSLRAAKITQIV